MSGAEPVKPDPSEAVPTSNSTGATVDADRVEELVVYDGAERGEPEDDGR